MGKTRGRKGYTEIGDKKIELQHPGTPWFWEHNDNCTTRNGLQRKPYIEGFLRHVVISKKADGSHYELEDFEVEESMDLMNECDRFLKGKPLENEYIPETGDSQEEG